MNSKQRRNKRIFEHEVTLVAGSRQGERYERYFEFDRRVEAAKGWLQWTTKRKNYIIGPKQYDRQTFKFCSGALATAFALKWA